MSGRGRVTATTVLVLALMFVSGVLVGRAWDITAPDVAAAEPAAAEAESQNDDNQNSQPMYMQVGLTDAQRVTIDSIVVEYRGQMRELRGAYRASAESARAAYDSASDEMVDEVREVIKGVMTPEQVEQYDVLLMESDERRRARREAREREEANDD